MGRGEGCGLSLLAGRTSWNLPLYLHFPAVEEVPTLFDGGPERNEHLGVDNCLCRYETEILR